MSLFWSMLFGAVAPAIVVWAFGRHLRRISGQPGLADYMRRQQMRAKRHKSRDPVWSLLVQGGDRNLTDDEVRGLERKYDPGDRYRARR